MCSNGEPLIMFLDLVIIYCVLFVVLVFNVVLQQLFWYLVQFSNSSAIMHMYFEIGRGNWLLGRVLKIMYSNGSLKLCTCCEFGRGNRLGRVLMIMCSNGVVFVC